MAPESSEPQETAQGSPVTQENLQEAVPLTLRPRRWRRVLWALPLGMALAWWGLPWCVPLPERLAQPQPVSVSFLSSDGRPLRQLLSREGQRVANTVSFEALPPSLIHATLAAEDKRFFSHGGVDLVATARALWDNLTSQRVVSGASTLTQQLAKISASGRAQRNLLAKATEALQARRIEMSWDKQRILTEYLNRVGYGNLLAGCASAAEGYFHKPLRDLSPAECAFLAAIPQSPARLNPFRNLKAVQRRQKHILERMADLGWLSEEEKTLALAEKPSLKRFIGGFEAPHAVEMLGKDHLAPPSARATATNPQVRLTLDYAVQREVERVIEQRLAVLASKHVTHAAAVVIENKTGHVLALAGSRDYFSGEGGQINGAWVPHSPGSALKPFTYLLALQHGLTPASIIADIPVEYPTSTGLYRPENYDRKTYGPVTLRDALGNSLNIPAVRVLQQIGGESRLYDFLTELGLSTLTENPEHYGLGLTIGNAPVRLLELANAYACLARLGEWKPYSLLPEPSIIPPPSENAQLLDRRLPYLIADILSDPQARVVSFGPRSVIRLPFPCAVKTGTSTNYRDNWTMGYTPEFTVGVWCGNFDNSPMANVSGVTGAGPIFRDIMMWLHKTRGTSWYAEPEGILQATIDPRNGKRVPEAGPPIRSSRSEIFLSGTLPPLSAPEDYDTEGRALLPPEFGPWIAQGQHWLTGLVAARPAVRTASAPHILSPVNGSVFVLDPELPEKGACLLLRATGDGAIRWSSRTLEVSIRDGFSYATLAPGSHELCAADEVTGAETRTRVEVKDMLSRSQPRSR